MQSSAARDKWQAPSVARRYAEGRWSSERKRQRDPRLIGALLGKHLSCSHPAEILDVPCGTARLRPMLLTHGRYVGLDVSPAMLAAAGGGHGGRLLEGDAQRLPFRDSTFDAVVCCRLLHHLSDEREFERVVAELVRVSRGLVLASFWDAGSLAHLRRRLFPGRRAPRRFARGRGQIRATLERAGAEVLDWRHSLRFVTRQAFVVARKRRMP